jgi:hypothetical protein
MLASIESSYQGLLGLVKDQMDDAIRERDASLFLKLQRELKRYENEKASQINSENARHNAAIAACRR